MAANEVERRLTAVVSADVAGYSRLMADDEAGTLARLRRYVEELFVPRIAQHRGRIVKLMGDGILAEFPSVVDAVECCVGIQKEMVERDGEVPPEQRIRFRVGITVGDIIVQGDDIYGNAVNAAARIQALAEPGDVYISGGTRQQLGNLLDLSYEDLGEHRVKNIDEPVRVYRVMAGGAPAMAGARTGARRGRRALWPIAIAASVAMLALALFAIFGRTPEAPPAVPVQAPTAQAPVQPSIAVLPFADLSPAQDQEYFSDGVAEELLNTLTQVHGLRVAARTSSFAFKGRNEDVRKIGELLNVSTVLEGSVRKGGDKVRITAQLIDVDSGYHLWSESFDRELNDIFAVQDEIASAIVSALKGKLMGDAQAAPATARAANVQAYDLYLAGRHRAHQRTPESLHSAIELFEQAIALDGNYAPAYSGLADAYMLLYNYGNMSAARTIDQAQPAIDKALALDPTLGEAYASLGLLRSEFLGDRAAGEVAYRRGIELNPGYSMTHMWRGSSQYAVGHIEAAAESFRTAHRLDPLHPTVSTNLAVLLADMGHYQEAKSVLQRLLDAGVAGAISYRALAFVDDQYGRFDRELGWALKAVEASADPASLLQVAVAYRHLGRFEDAERWLEKAEASAPENLQVTLERFALLTDRGERRLAVEFGNTLLSRAEAAHDRPDYEIRGLAATAGAAELRAGNAERAAALIGKAFGARERTGFGINTDINLLSDLALAYRRAGQPGKADDALARAEAILTASREQGLDGPYIVYQSARLLALQGRRAQALDELQRTYDLGGRVYWSFAADPAWDALRDDPRLQQLAAKVKADVDAMAAAVESRQSL